MGSAVFLVTSTLLAVSLTLAWPMDMPAPSRRMLPLWIAAAWTLVVLAWLWRDHVNRKI
jgi:hypothetical protein